MSCLGQHPGLQGNMARPAQVNGLVVSGWPGPGPCRARWPVWPPLGETNMLTSHYSVLIWSYIEYLVYSIMRYVLRYNEHLSPLVHPFCYSFDATEFKITSSSLETLNSAY